GVLPSVARPRRTRCTDVLSSGDERSRLSPRPCSRPHDARRPARRRSRPQARQGRGARQPAGPPRGRRARGNPVRPRAHRARERRDLARRRHPHLSGPPRPGLPQSRPGGAADRLGMVQPRRRGPALRRRAAFAAGRPRVGGLAVRLSRSRARGGELLPTRQEGHHGPQHARHFLAPRDDRAGRAHPARRHPGADRGATPQMEKRRRV
ncbi:MAG: tRNA (cytidine(32)/uridine(32)-2'-O)-methyltransferase, partial [uncultured Microvirga sp.]